MKKDALARGTDGSSGKLLTEVLEKGILLAIIGRCVRPGWHRRERVLDDALGLFHCD